MRGSIQRRYKGSWSIILHLGYVTDATTGKRRRKQQWITVRGTKRDAERRLADLLHDTNHDLFVAPSKVTVGEWLDDWLDKAIKPPRRTQRAYDTYRGVIANHLKPALGTIPLQQLRAAHLERYHADLGLAPATGQQHHAIIGSALKAAVKAGLVHRNVATLVENRPHAPEGHEDVMAHVWEAHEARAFLATARAAGAQPAAFYTLALETGLRKSELCGLKWSDLDVGAGRLTVVRQLVKPGPAPTFGPVKNKTPRQLELSAETLALLQAHRRHQAELKLANRPVYHDHGLMFAKEWREAGHQTETLGDPLQANNLGEREFARLTQAAGVRRIKFHGLRHTCATLLLQAGEPAHVVQRRLGHKRIEMTLGIYAHALPAQQQQAADRLSALLHSIG